MKSSLISLGAAVALIAGCSTVERTSPGIMAKFDVVGSDVQATETVLIRNSGWTLVYIIPGLFGDVTWDPKANDGKGDINGGLWVLRDKCNVSDCYETLQKLAEQSWAPTASRRSRTTSTKIRSGASSSATGVRSRPSA